MLGVYNVGERGVKVTWVNCNSGNIRLLGLKTSLVDIHDSLILYKIIPYHTKAWPIEVNSFVFEVNIFWHII